MLLTDTALILRRHTRTSQKLRRDVYNLNHMGNGLQAFLKCVRNTAKHLRQEIKLLESLKLDTLPEHIIRTIFEYAFVGGEGNDFTHNITKVCRRFYAIAKGAPVLWSRVSTRRKITRLYVKRKCRWEIDIGVAIDNMTTFFERSKGLPLALEVALYWPKKAHYVKYLLSFIRSRNQEHFDRVESLCLQDVEGDFIEEEDRIDPYRDTVEDSDFGINGLENLAGFLFLFQVGFPSVKRITIGHVPHIEIMEMVKAFLENVFYAPVVRDIALHSRSSSLPESCLQQISSCTVHLRDPNDVVCVIQGQKGVALHTSKSLEVLNIRLDADYDEVFMLWDAGYKERDECAEFLSVKHFNFRLEGRDPRETDTLMALSPDDFVWPFPAANVIWKVLQKLRMPNVETMSFDVTDTTSKGAGLHDVLPPMLFDRRIIFQKLRIIQMKITVGSDNTPLFEKGVSFPMNYLCIFNAVRFPSLTHLILANTNCSRARYWYLPRPSNGHHEAWNPLWSYTPDLEGRAALGKLDGSLREKKPDGSLSRLGGVHIFQIPAGIVSSLDQLHDSLHDRGFKEKEDLEFCTEE
jgi:hypothetical protein